MATGISEQIHSWREQLLDTSKRNRLIHFRSGRGGGISLLHPDPADLWQRLVIDGLAATFAWQSNLIDLPEDDQQRQLTSLFDPDEPRAAIPSQVYFARCRESPRLKDDQLLTDLPDNLLASRLVRLALNARESLTEQGVTTLYVAFGFLRWFASPDSTDPIRSPLLLVPAHLDRESVESPWRLRCEDEDLLPNHTLAQRLHQDFKLVLPLPKEEDGDLDPNWRTEYFGEIERSLKDYPSWEVLDEVAVGTFAFQKLAMWEDLERNQERIGAHDLCRAIARDPSVSLAVPSDLPRAEQLDEKTQPATTHHILDADSSQHAAIVAATKGASLVLDGPPGTGKSQTIANTIAEFLAAGKTVLFVSEKTAALEVVKRRLDDRRLGDFCLELHSHKANKREIITELGRCLDLPPESYRDPSEELSRLLETRTRLNDYVRELHTKREPLGLTAFQVHGQLAALHLEGRSSRCPVAEVLSRDAGYLRQVTELLRRLTTCRKPIEENTQHPWYGCLARESSLTQPDDVRHNLEQLGSLLGKVDDFPELRQMGFLPPEPTRLDWQSARERTSKLLGCPVLPPNWFVADPTLAAQAVVQLEPLTKRCRQLGASLPEFSADAIWQAPSLSDLTPTALEKAGLVSVPGETGRQLGQRLQRITGEVADLMSRAESAQQLWQKVNSHLGANLATLPVKSLQPFAEMMEALARLKSVPKSWWQAGRRSELQEVFARCQSEFHSAGVLRLELMKRLSLSAFLVEKSAVALEASGYTSFLSRLLPRWWSLKRQVAVWYPQQSPGTALLLKDLAALAEYHRHMDFCRQAQEHYAKDVLLDAQGQADWVATLEGLATVARLTQLVKIPGTVQTALAKEERLDREGLASASLALSEQLGQFLERIDSVGRDQDLREILEDGGIGCRLDELIRWLATRLARLQAECALVNKLLSLLQTDLDLPLAQLPERCSALVELGRCRGQIASLKQQLQWGEDGRAIENRDWTPMAQRASAFLSLSGSWGRPFEECEAQALHDPVVRQKLQEQARRMTALAESGLDQGWQFLDQLFPSNRAVSEGIVIERTPLSQLQRWLAAREGQVERLGEWTRFAEIEEGMSALGVRSVLDEIRSGQVELDEVDDAFRVRFLRLWLDALYARVPALRQFSGADQDARIEQFRELDRRSIQIAPLRIRQQLLGKPDRPGRFTGEPPPSSELGILQHEVHKKRRHLPLRKLFAQVPRLLLELKPCLMMSPLAVSTYLESPEIHFDLVIFDEASQVRPHDAICAIYRGKQLMVAGDQKQLPPTSFFERAAASDEDTEEGDNDFPLRDFDSILDVCCTLNLPRRRLRWHYRSRREALIAFANRHVYDNELVTFPSVEDMRENPAIRFLHVSDGQWRTGASGGFNSVEAKRTAELVLEHFRENPNRTLGVIAFSQRQQLRILDALEQLRRANPEMEDFFHEDKQDPFFVKNLENVQGDERDVIFLAIGYGPDENGRVHMRFGPLNQEGGERRLNVAVTRARQGMTVITSLRAQDIDLSRTNARGVQLLRAYLDYAERGPDALRGAITQDSQRDFESPFEEEVALELKRQGLTVHRQVGCSGFRIDLAVVDADAPGRYLLGVECDGASYHSAATARDRDRLRQEVLEGLGWRISRVWSTDWLRNRGEQVDRVLEAVLDAQTAPPGERPEKTPLTVGMETAVTKRPRKQRESSYDSIDDVPEPVLVDEVLRVVRQCGATRADDLTASVSRVLGFRRTGTKIQGRIEEAIDRLQQDGSLVKLADGRLQATTRVGVGPS